MSKEFQLHLIRKSLDDLGYPSLAAQLAAEIRADDPASSHPSRLFSQYLRTHIQSGDYASVLHILSSVQPGNPQLDLHQSVIDYLACDSVVTLLASLSILRYLVHRFDMLERVIDRSSSPDDDTHLIEYLRQNMGSLLDDIEHYLAQAATSPLARFSDFLLSRLNKKHESNVFLPLIMQSPLDAAEVDHHIFCPDVILVENIHDIEFNRDGFSHLLATISKSKLRLALLHVLLGSASPHPDVSFPDNYLHTLIGRARLFSLQDSLYYLPERLLKPRLQQEVALLPDDDTSKKSFPSHLLHSLHEHTDEVWFTRFSPSGHYLVTGSVDGRLIIYDVLNNFSVLAVLDANLVDHSHLFVPNSYKPTLNKSKGVIYCCWDEHEKYLVSCCSDTVVRVWLVENITNKNKRITRSMDDNHRLVCCFTLGENVRLWLCEFLPHRPNTKPHFLVGLLDIKLKAFTVDGEELFDFHAAADDTILESDTPDADKDDKDAKFHFSRINDLAITPDGNTLITASNDKNIRIYTIPDLFDPDLTTTRLATIKLLGRLTSCSVSHSGKYLLVSTAPEELQVWDISTLQASHLPFHNKGPEPPLLKMKLYGHTQELYIVRSCFGYVNTSTGEEELVITGSDTGHVYFWKLHTGQLITRVKAHDGLCNSVDWNRNFNLPRHSVPHVQGPDFGTYWCSVGDDKAVKVWGPPPSD